MNYLVNNSFVNVHSDRLSLFYLDGY